MKTKNSQQANLDTIKKKKEGLSGVSKLPISKGYGFISSNLN